eukprot:CAMPEP_0196575058 /NCGR_PEP_ID=MMETSP1081-20130531/4627_1 /TAXON_ID=36882 /ORGANISM="Pyramimonas amylifera, Strain CCMP720" /LENGTH=96 /DNA_ID=CAMNT_0041893247 /DNA_START=244 /DNA_END=531 /DNA_ORIENTATION=-
MTKAGQFWLEIKFEDTNNKCKWSPILTYMTEWLGLDKYEKMEDCTVFKEDRCLASRPQECPVVSGQSLIQSDNALSDVYNIAAMVEESQEDISHSW